MKRNIIKIAICAAVAVALTACTEGKFQINGNISNAKDSVLYLENMSLDGPVKTDSVKLGEDGAFSFSGAKPDAPEFYRLRIAAQIINLSIDSTETVTVKAQYPGMASNYTVEGSENCSKIKELALKQMALQQKAREIAQNEQAADSLGLNSEEKAFYDALTRPQAVKDFYTNEQLDNMTKELTEELRKNRTIDWQKKESARAGMRSKVKRLLKKYHYPPEEEQSALETVIHQCEQWADVDASNYEEYDYSAII